MQFIEMSGKTLTQLVAADEFSPEELAAAGVSDESVVRINRQGDIDRCRELGIERYLIKPVKRRELLEAILATFGKRSSQVTQSTSEPKPESVDRVVRRGRFERRTHR